MDALRGRAGILKIDVLRRDLYIVQGGLPINCINAGRLRAFSQ
jgi:hypothetical protein